MNHFGLNEAQQQLCEQHLDLLEKWNKVYNLTAIRKRQDMAIKHLNDSLAVLPHLPKDTSFNMVDVGTGGGFPGIPLAIAKPECSFTLIDSSLKKVRFLKQVVAELHLKNVNPVHARVEEYSPTVKFDGVISRAFSAIDNMVGLTKHLLADGGHYYAMKGPEQETLPDSISLAQDITLEVPGLDAQRHLLVLKTK